MAYFYEFAAPVGVFAVRSAIDLAAPVEFYAGIWPWRTVPPMAAPDVIVEMDGSHMTVLVAANPTLSQKATSLVESASVLLDVLTRLCLEQMGPFVDLHAGSAVIDGQLVVFPGPSLAGKSTLALQLASRGHLLGGDDRVLLGPLQEEPKMQIQGVTLGLNARMRLPVNPRAGAAFVDYVASRTRHADWLPPRIGFIFLREGEAARFAQRFPLAAIVMPLRREAGGVGLEPAPFSDIMRLLLEQTHAPHLPARQLIEAARLLAQTLPCFTLRFDDSGAAAEEVERLARSGFRDWRA